MTKTKKILSEISSMMVLWAMAYGVLCSLPAGAAETLDPDVSKVESVIADLMAEAPGRKLSKSREARLELSADIVNAARIYNVPPILLTVISFKESSFRTTAEGKIGEKGLTQVHGLAARGCDLSTRHGQLQCGARWLSVSLQMCKNWPDAVSAYACGGCIPPTKKVKKIVQRRIDMWKDYENAI